MTSSNSGPLRAAKYLPAETFSFIDSSLVSPSSPLKEFSMSLSLITEGKREFCLLSVDLVLKILKSPFRPSPPLLMIPRVSNPAKLRPLLGKLFFSPLPLDSLLSTEKPVSSDTCLLKPRYGRCLPRFGPLLLENLLLLSCCCGSCSASSSGTTSLMSAKLERGADCFCSI